MPTAVVFSSLFTAEVSSAFNKGASLISRTETVIEWSDVLFTLSVALTVTSNSFWSS